MSDSNTFWVTGYLPNGVKVSFTIALNSLADACKESTAFTDQLLAQGFRISETGLDTGEQSYTITHIARRVQPGKDGKPDTPIIDFYHDDLAFSGLKTWLNTPAQIASFEQWSGISLAAVPEYDGTAALKRGERAALDAKYIVALAPGKRVIWKHNPDYTEGSKTEAKRIFVRFDGIAAAAPAPTNSNGNSKPAQQDQDRDGNVTAEGQIAIVTNIIPRVSKKNNTYYDLITDSGKKVVAWSRDVFRDAWNVEEWTENNKSYALEPHAEIRYVEKPGTNGGMPSLQVNKDIPAVPVNVPF